MVSALTGEAWKFNFDASRSTGLNVEVMSIVLLFVVSCAEVYNERTNAIEKKKYFLIWLIIAVLIFSRLSNRGLDYSLTLLPLASSAVTSLSLRSASCLRLSIFALSTTLLYVAFALK